MNSNKGYKMSQTCYTCEKTFDASKFETCPHCGAWHYICKEDRVKEWPCDKCEGGFIDQMSEDQDVSNVKKILERVEIIRGIGI